MKLPEGFTRRETEQAIVVLRRELEEQLFPWLAQPPWIHPERFDDARWLEGRTRIPSVELEPGRRVVLRSYRHGGLLRGLTRDIFVGILPRPLRELALSEAARRRGVATPPVLGAAVYPLAGPVYRGLVAVEEVDGARDGLSVLEQAEELSPRQRRKLFKTLLPLVGSTVAEAHEAGLVHTDLNVKNLLVSPSPLSVLVIDLDRCRLEPGPLDHRQRRSQLRRLRRSLDKLTAGRGLTELSERDLLCFVKGYTERAGIGMRDFERIMDGWC